MEVPHLLTLTKDDVLQFYKEFIRNDAAKRHKVCTHIRPTVKKTPESQLADAAAAAKGADQVALQDAMAKLTAMKEALQPSAQTDNDKDPPPPLKEVSCKDLCLFIARRNKY